MAVSWPWVYWCREVPSTGVIIQREVFNREVSEDAYSFEYYKQRPPICTVNEEECPMCSGL
jgi:hypothetical protein